MNLKVCISENNTFHITCLILGAMVSLFLHSYCVNSLNSESLVHAEQVTFSGVTLDHFIVESLMTLLKEFPLNDGNGTNCRKTKSEQKWRPR